VVNLVLWSTTCLFPLRESLVVLTVGLYAYMLIIPFAEAAEQTILQRVVPYERQGRVFGFAQSVEQAASPLTAFLVGPLTQFIVIPSMTDGRAADAIGGWFGTGPDRGIALVFLLAGVVGLTATVLALASRPYRRLSAAVEAAGPSVRSKSSSRWAPRVVRPGPATPARIAGMARVVVDVMPKPEILDPQGKAVTGGARPARVSRASASARASASSSRSTATSPTRSWPTSTAPPRPCSPTPSSRRSTSGWTPAGGGRLMAPQVGVVTFPGSLDDHDALRAVRLAGAEPVSLWHASDDLRGVDAIILPGGFSYGDYLRAGAISSFSPVMRSVVDAANAGCRCWASATGSRSSARRTCSRRAHPQRRPDLRVRRPAAPGGVRRHRVDVRLHRGAGDHHRPQEREGGFVADEDTLDRLEGEAGSSSATWVATRTARSATSPASPNERGNVVGLMPHPEHDVDPLTGPGTDGTRSSAASRASSPPGLTPDGASLPAGRRPVVPLPRRPALSRRWLAVLLLLAGCSPGSAGAPAAGAGPGERPGERAGGRRRRPGPPALTASDRAVLGSTSTPSRSGP
jgi:hypothetical protein